MEFLVRRRNKMEARMIRRRKAKREQTINRICDELAPFHPNIERAALYRIVSDLTFSGDIPLK